jgi:hypothetical protein
VSDITFGCGHQSADTKELYTLESAVFRGFLSAKEYNTVLEKAIFFISGPFFLENWFLHPNF